MAAPRKGALRRDEIFAEAASMKRIGAQPQ
jgi:hypothetical protein